MPIEWLSNRLSAVPSLWRKQYTFPNGLVIDEVKPLSEGGFAYVSLGKDPATGEEYALKRMICQDKKRFDLAKHEVEVLNALPEHKNIVRFFWSLTVDNGTVGNNLKKEVVMLLELCPGGTLLGRRLLELCPGGGRCWVGGEVRGPREREGSRSAVSYKERSWRLLVVSTSTIDFSPIGIAMKSIVDTRDETRTTFCVLKIVRSSEFSFLLHGGGMHNPTTDCVSRKMIPCPQFWLVVGVFVARVPGCRKV